MYKIYLLEKDKVRNRCDMKFDESRNSVELLKDE